jgi:hypothetical protein
MAAYRAQEEASDEQNNEVVSMFREAVDFPYCIISESGSIVTLNDAMKQITEERENYFNLPLDSLFEIKLSALIENTCADEADEQSSDEELSEEKKDAWEEWELADVSAENIRYAATLCTQADIFTICSPLRISPSSTSS